MELSSLEAVSPIDGRYRKHTSILTDYFSESALIRYRILVEIEYFIALSKTGIPQFPEIELNRQDELRKIYEEFTLSDAERVKEIEAITNHDVKAVEYFIKERIKGSDLENHSEFIHFGLTSQDINNTAVPLSIKEALLGVYLPKLDEIIENLKHLSQEWAKTPMLARTHGQPASPTTLGKEIRVFIERLEQQQSQLSDVPVSAKFGGATGNMNAHFVAFPSVDWHSFADDFVQNTLELDRSFPTTQIEHYDNLAALFDAMKRIHTILIDLNRDMWTYISMDYFKQKIKEGEVGSSAMPHKVNPIDFENSEGNLGIANAVCEHLSAKLPTSRLQRDLTDSTVLRNVGVPFGHALIAFNSTLRGLSKLLINREKIDRDLEDNWAVVAEAIQTILRREGYPKPYEALKQLTRTNQVIDQKSIHAFINSLNIDDQVKEEMRAISPSNYTGK